MSKLTAILSRQYWLRIHPVRDGVIVSCVIFVIALISILTMYIQATNAYQVQMHKHLLDNARAAATLVDGDLHQQLDSPDKNLSELHRQMLKPLYNFLKAMRGVRYLYTMVLIDDQVYFVLDSPSPYKPDEDSANVMEPYDDADPEMLVALREGREMVTKDFYVDQWGTYMSAYVPIYTSAGEMIGILGVDMTLEEYFQRLAVMRRVLFFTIGISLLLSVAMGLVVFAARRVVKNYEVQLEQDRIIIENSKTMLFRWRTDSGWPMELVSDNVRQFGYKAEDLLSRMVTYASIIHPDDLDRVITEVKHYEDSGAESFEQDYRIICADSSVRWVYERTIVERDKNGRAHHFQGVVIDITERKNNETRMQQLLRDEVAVWDVLFSQSSDGIVVLDQDGSVYQMNKRYADMLGYSMEEAHQLHVWDWDCQFSKEEIIEMLRTADESGVHFETKQRRKDGTLIDVELSNNSAVYKGKKLAFCIVRDISERKRVEEQIRRFATTDSLTGIANRREFTRIVESEIDRAKRYGTPLSLIMYDLDLFKRVNDTFGHDVGDDVLQTVSRLVKENIRSVDVTGRWGGEEFMVLLPQTDLDSANKVAEKLRQAIELHRFNKVGQVTASFGLTQFVPEDDIELLTKRVDEALYQAKKRGRNCVEILVGGERKSDK